MGDISGGSSIDPSFGAVAREVRSDATRETSILGQAQQVASKRAFRAAVEDSFNPFSADRKTEEKSMKDRRGEIKTQGEETTFLKDPAAAAAADKKSKDNPELAADKLIMLRQLILKGDQKKETILNQVLEMFDDAALADEALEYVLETTSGDQAARVEEAREALQEKHGRTVKAGRNMGAESRTFGDKEIGSPRELRELYLGVTAGEQEHNALFEQLSADYEYPELKEVVAFLLKSLGADLRSAGASAETAMLYQTVTEVRMLQSILGVYNYFLMRQLLIEKQFHQHGLRKSKRLNFEALAKAYMQMVEERYPSAVKLLRLARDLDIEDELLSQIIVFSQFRDAVRLVPPRIYRTIKQRYDLLMCFVEALEELEDQLEEEEEEDDEEEEEDEVDE